MSITTTLAARWHHDDIALDDDTGPMSYGALHDQIGQTRSWLGQRGIGPGDVIAVQLDKSRAMLCLFLATVSIGAVFVPINPRATSAEADLIANDSDAALTVRLPPRLDGLRAAPAPTIDPSIEAVRLYTSGTTGRPKGVRLSHNNVLATVTALHEAWGWRRSDVLLHVLPIHHVHGLFVALLGALYAGARTDWHRGFDVDAVVRDLPDATVFMGVPTLYHRLLNHPELATIDLSHLRLFTSGSAPLPAHEHTAFSRLTGHDIVERYGMTEVGIALSNPLLGVRRPGRVGFALPTVEVRIVNDGTVEQVDDDVVGMLHVRGPSVFMGYHDRPEADAATRLADGWFCTGDLATRADDGSIAIVGRSDDLMLSGGYNIYPAEIEAALCELPGVEQAAVFALPDDDLGQRVCALIVGDADLQELPHLLRDALSRYKVPRQFTRVASLPRNAMGKLIRPALAALA